jgi:pyruvyl transferase EpsO
MAVEIPVSAPATAPSRREDLAALIHARLAPLVQGSCCLLDVPGHRNIGDLLIWRGEMDFLANLGMTPGYVAASGRCDPRRVAGYDTILLHGGGNFGDLWHSHQRFRESLVTRFTDRRIVLFPQTVHFRDAGHLEDARRAFSAHPDLHLCVRDAESHRFVLANFPDNHAHLLPDMAFCIDGLDERLAVTRREKWLLLQRIDQEQSGSAWPLDAERFETRDWPTLSASFAQRAERRLLTDWHKLTHRIRLRLPSSDIAIDGFSPYLTGKAIRMGAEFLSAYDLVVSTRLHGHILSLLLGIPNVLVDNSYGKNRTFFDAWTREFPGTAFAEDAAALRLAVARLVDSA